MLHNLVCQIGSYGMDLGKEIKYTAMHGLKLSTQQKPTTKLIVVAQNGYGKERPLMNLNIKI